MQRYCSLKIIVICSTLYSFSINNLGAQSLQKCELKNTTIFHGELIKYNVFYTLAGVYVPAGEAAFSTTLSKHDGKPVFLLSGVGNTYPSYDWFFKVRDIYESIVDTTTLLPIQFTRNVSEGSHKMYHKAIFNREKNVATSNNIKTIISDCVQDVLSMIYYARNIDYNQFKTGDFIPYDLYLDNKMYSLYLKYMGKQVIKTKYGSFDCFKIKPKLIEGTIFRGGEEMTVYVSNDKRKIPIYIETPIIVGKIKVYYVPN
ncbi:MAG: DUF3108 domain-containing protein [Chitinophagaceae bacterium]|nr:DUF3108 domain-containing protein [Chitinophagaceae bacterium]HMN32318.1 DUF3108 domain-containing protein [Chitinophagaceae bacterium]